MSKKLAVKHIKLIDAALEAIIDQWYLSVSDYYVTSEKKAEDPTLEIAEELKRFHDEKGHRIKFAKGDLDFTYGLIVRQDSDACCLEVSVNNKVPGFDYGDLVRRLSAHYEASRNRPLGGFPESGLTNEQVLVLADELRHSIAIEQREGKADIVRLRFNVRDKNLGELADDPGSFMEMIHEYCVAPLRRLYAEVYRSKLGGRGR